MEGGKISILSPGHFRRKFFLSTDDKPKGKSPWLDVWLISTLNNSYSRSLSLAWSILEDKQ